MEKYKVIGTLGEGSFGRVYKAKQISSGNLVALKVISKRGRSNKELKGFRRECEIQRNLNHPNIIQMLESFETENEIVVITEFAHKELTSILSKAGFLPEEQVQHIVWDLVSALFYLHSNRVLHRDLKPQNILLDINNNAKLCDFGFARNMSRGTHVLTSIKGTPLYMAPELIDEQPYDYTADLWSLGCIIYEMLMGTPPFSTNSILHLIRLITHEQIQWPTFHSDLCISFLKGLLQKNPAKRITWEEILNHPFVKGHIIISENSNGLSLTKPMTPTTLNIKEQQKTDNIKNRIQEAWASNKDIDGNQENSSVKNLDNKEIKLDCYNLESAGPLSSKEVNKDMCSNKEESLSKFETHDKEYDNNKENIIGLIGKHTFVNQSFNFMEENQPIETEEWIAFLQKSIQEVLSGELICLMQTNQTNIIISPLRNTTTNSRVLNFIAKLLSLPLILRGVSKDNLQKIKMIYLKTKLVPILVHASILLLREHKDEYSSYSTPSPDNLSINSLDIYKIINSLSDDDTEALEHIFLLITHLVYWDDEFLIQFCDAVIVFTVYVQLRLLLSLTSKGKDKLVSDVLAILTHILRKYPENSSLIEKILINNTNHCSTGSVHFVDLLRHSNPTLRERTCYFLQFIGKSISNCNVNYFWNDNIKETLEALMYDSIEIVRIAAEAANHELRNKKYYSSN